MLFHRDPDHERSSRGQSLVEFAIVLPILLLVLLMAIDFGRVFFGWVGLQNVARIGASYAGQYPEAEWDDPTDVRRISYEAQVAADAAAINCVLPNFDDMLPQFPEGTDPGDDVIVELDCQFSLITPFLAPLFGGMEIPIAADAVFPVRGGVFSGPSGGGPGPNPDPPTPTCRTVPDLSTLTVANARTAWTDAGFVGTFFPVSTAQDDEIVTAQATNPSAAVGACVNQSTTVTVDSDPVTVTCAADEDIVPGLVGLRLRDAKDVWDDDTNFTGAFAPVVTNANRNNTVATQTTNPAFSPGDCAPLTTTITLTLGSPPPPPNCTVPNFIGSSSIGAQSTWSASGFTTTVSYRQQGQLPYIINEQTLVSDSLLACNSGIQVGP